ncbi:CAP domain-containing protein [Ramlibacter sp.]|uniref:CAP domain-containing protein n=1 Tax=Ramlibacter sp. TaxID=1917967 RepID=UPI0017E5ED4E|nr:CAP domain-containing protein [Ramlibacter sp.]MBA2675375.1 CAP domain-containing protein [Ramlibacter sp.]
MSTIHPFFSSLVRGTGAVLMGSLALHAGIAAASPFSGFSGAPCNVPGMRAAILQQVNAVRATGADCGGERFGAARTVGWNEQLFTAADVHSRDMAASNYFSHESLRGTRAYQRVEAQGYRWKSVAENIAAGDFTVRGVMDAWMQSDGHCRNIMDPGYTEIAVSCVSRPGTTYGDYWTMVLARKL